MVAVREHPSQITRMLLGATVDVVAMKFPSKKDNEA
jgi:hypothetical protein